MSKLMDDPVEQFGRLFHPVLDRYNGQLLQDSLRDVIEAPLDGADGALDARGRVEAAAAHIAEHSQLNIDEARAFVQPKLKALREAGADPATAARALATELPAAQVAIDLQTPAMLGAGPRVFLAVFSTAGSVLAAVFVYALATRASVPTTGLVMLTLLGALFLLTALILVMGYKKVAVHGSVGGESTTAPAGKTKQ